MIKTKYTTPRNNKYLISRPSLHQKLNHSLTCRYTTVIAPAGYGKTSAVLAWLETCNMPAAWLSMSDSDNDSVLFWRYVCAALDGIAKGLSKDVEYIFSSLELLQANIHINILIDRLSGMSSDFLLVLDDLHLITEPYIFKNLQYLIDYLPFQMHLVLISRTEPQLDLAVDKVKWQIQQIDEKDLRFQNEEIYRFYQARGFTLETEDVNMVETYTEGWAAALVAVAMSMEKGAGKHDAINTLSRASRDINQYLKSEVTCTWPEAKQTFMIKTCILETLSAPLCDAVTGETNGHRMLEELNKSNGFLAALDEQQQEYRYHHLFKSFLYELLVETAPLEIASLHTRAAVWFQDQGLVKNAMEHLLDAGSYREALELIEYHVYDIFEKKEFGTLLSWINKLPEELKNMSFQAAYINAIYYADIDRYDLSKWWIDRMKALMLYYQHSASPELNSYRKVGCTLSEAYLLTREGNADYIPVIISASEINKGKFYKMLDFFDFNTMDIYYYRSPICNLAKMYGENPDKYNQAIDSYRNMISKNPGYKQLGAGEYHYEKNYLEESLPYLLEAMEEAQDVGCPGALVPAMINIARINRARGDILGALGVLDECERRLQSIGKPHWNYLLNAFRCRLNIDAGDTARTEEWFASCKLNIFTEITRSREFELLVYSRILISRGRLQDAGLVLQRLLTFTENGRLHSRVEILNLLAMLAYHNNDMSGMVNYLESSLLIGMKEGYVRSYLDESTSMANLLGYYATRKRKTSNQNIELKKYARKLLDQMQNHHQTVKASTEASSDAIAKLLTRQEQKVLDLLMKAETNAEISHELGIGLTTVKTHTGNIYSKLGVKNRVQCMELIRKTRNIT